MMDETTAPKEIRLIRKRPLCDALGVSIWTIDRWVSEKKFPAPIYTSDDAPARWRLRDVDAWLEKRGAKRRHKPKPRGRLVSRMTAEERAARRGLSNG